MGVQESKATRCTQADIKKWFLNYVDTHASQIITPQDLGAFVWKYKLEHKCPELDDHQIFLILFEYYVELTVSGKINLKRNNEDDINDLAAVARSIKEEKHLTFSVFNITLILCAYHIYEANDLEAIPKIIKKEHDLVDFTVSDIEDIIYAYRIKLRNEYDEYELRNEYDEYELRNEYDEYD